MYNFYLKTVTFISTSQKMPNLLRTERMSEDEIEFLKRRYIKESKNFYTGMKWLLVAILMMPFLVLLVHRYYDGNDGLSDKEVWLYAQLIMMAIYIFALAITYFRLLHPYVQDLKLQEKVVETVLILEKKFMPQNNTYHFYINSEPTYSIEVDQDTFLYYHIQDAINIEYTRHSEIYLGYF